MYSCFEENNIYLDNEVSHWSTNSMMLTWKSVPLIFMNRNENKPTIHKIDMCTHIEF
jgi:hypothetical protein